MAQPGWYPDPGGAPGRYRFWNGTAWSADTTADPFHAPAPGMAGGPEPRRHSGRLAGAAVLALAVVVGFFVHHNAAAGVRTDTITTPPTISAWNESTPKPQAGNGGRTAPAPTPGRQAPAGASSMKPCPVDKAAAAVQHPDDDRIHGGGLSVVKTDLWTPDDPGLLPFASDVTSEENDMGDTVALGALHHAAGFTQMRASAAGVLRCYVSIYREFYQFVGTRIDQPVTIAGRRGWWRRDEYLWGEPGDEQPLHVYEDALVVDTGDPSAFSFWLSDVAPTPGASADDLETGEALRLTLRVDS